VKSKAENPVAGLVLLIFCCLVPVPMRAQAARATLSGTITSASGQPVPNAKVTLLNPGTNRTIQAETNLSGFYSVTNLDPGNYGITVSAEGFNTQTAKVTLAAGATQKVDLTLTAGLSLQGLGFSQSQTQGSAREQALLNKRSHMLKVHQELGLITTIPLLATVISGSFAGGRSTSSTARDLHAGLGSLTAGLYFTSAAYAIFAPKVPGTKSHGSVRLHKALAWIHGPGMILTPTLGAMAFAQRSRGERVHGIASLHPEVAYITAGAYIAAILAVSRPAFLSRSTHRLLSALHLSHPETVSSSFQQ
jgi:Carboxypeptidase regulatory-like domain